MSVRQVAILAAATLCAAAAQAQPQPAGGASSVLPSADAVLSLQEALDLAGAISPTREAADAAIRAAEASRIGAGRRPNPRAFAEVENFVGTGGYSGLEATEVTAGIELPLERGGKRSARIAVADARIESARVGRAVALADIRAAVTRLYIDAATAERRLANAQRQVEIAREGLRVASVRVRAGRASPIEEQRAEVARINAETELAEAERLLQTGRENLGRLLGRPVVEALDDDWLANLGTYGPAIPATAEASLALAEAEAELATAEARVRLATAQRTPDVSVSAGLRGFAETGDVAAVVGVSLPLMVFDNGRAAVDEARAERDRAAALRRAALLNAQTAIASAETELANAAARARAANGPALAAAEEAARIARIGYREGKFGQLDLLEAERTLAETRAAAIDALAAYHIAAAQLARLTAPLPVEGK
jgi:cobalt-zinc-cadmium efflux system outer membrane protein